MNRRKFISSLSLGTAFIWSGQFKSLAANEVFDLRDNVTLRFAIASDFHYGQPETAFEAMTDTLIRSVQQFHKQNPLDFCVLNGDIIHNDQSFLPIVKQKFASFTMPWFVTRGNHDLVSANYWQEVWNTPLNQYAEIKNTVLILGDTSDEKGTYLAPDLNWLKNSLDANKNKQSVFIFLHIPQAKWTKNGVDTPAFFELLAQYKNVKAVFHGHEHDQDGVYTKNNIPFYFDAHVGGNWGTPYKGFRVVEVLKTGELVTYMMNPTERI